MSLLEVISELMVFLVITLVGSVFVMSEMALVASRRSRLLLLLDSGDRRARVIMDLVKKPTEFLSTVQIGITVAGLLAGAFSGARLSEGFASFLSSTFPVLHGVAHEIALAVVIFGMALFTLIFGELVPKRIAISHPEAIALVLANFITWFIAIAIPFNYLFSACSNAVMRIFKIPDAPSNKVTANEVRYFLSEGVEAGILGAKERDMLEGVMRLADSSVKTIMTPRTDLFWVDRSEPPEILRQKIASCPYSLVVVANKSIDDVVGVVFKKDILSQLFSGVTVLNMSEVLRQPLMIPEGVNTLNLIERFRSYPVHCAFVLDEYGSLQGLVTLADIIHGITGYLADTNIEYAIPTRFEDGSWVMHGDTHMSELERYLNVPKVGFTNYHTLGGYLLSLLGRIPTVGDRVVIGVWTLEVVDMEGRRVGKVLVTLNKHDERTTV